MDIICEKEDELKNGINEVFMISEKEYIKSQQPIIDDFYKEYFTYDVTNMGYWLVSRLFVFVQLVFSAIPVQQMEEERIDGELLGIMVALFSLPVLFYLLAFLGGKDSIGYDYGKSNTYYSRIKYLPISVRALRLYRFKKMLGFVLKVFVVCVILQLGISMLVFHGITWRNLVFLVVYDLLIPFFVGCGVVGCTK